VPDITIVRHSLTYTAHTDSSALQPTDNRLTHMLDRRRYLSTFAVFALVLLRLVIGWHFFREGTHKVVYDRHDGELRITFSADGDGFLTNAKGPLAGLYRANAPDDHGWRNLLATPRRNVPATEAEATEQARWQTEYDIRRAAAKEKGELPPVEFPKSAPYSDWAERIEADWRKVVDDVKAVPALTDEQDKQAEKALNTRLQNVADYLAVNSEAIAEYRHELWRLANWRNAPESGEVPFVDDRITTKASETAKTPAPWVAQIHLFDEQLRDDLQGLLTAEQRDLALTTSAVESAISDSRQKRLHVINIVVTILTIGVGVCLLLGFLTRFASIIGALFLLGVILSQPPWLADAAPTMPQVIEFAALLVLAGAGAGRWAGLDYFTYALFNRNRNV
jgi:uncharacterized membrane protein YphA (DoxX/SURF4 family)